jgi:3-oxoacyl-[acyl-carrier protein] reductase
MFDFAAHRLVITGAAGGIGSATAELFLRAGASVHLIDLNEMRLAEVVKRLGSFGRVTFSVSALQSADACKQAMHEGGGNFSGLVHMAGVFEDDPLDGSHSVWTRAIESNLRSAYDAVIAYREFVDRSRVCSIVLASSRSFQRGGVGVAAYSAAKGGIVGLTRTFSRELAPNVRVNCVSPGLIQTQMTTKLIEKMGAQRLAEIPLARFGDPIDVAGPIAFLCSDAAAYVTGQVLTVDGGVING